MGKWLSSLALFAGMGLLLGGLSVAPAQEKKAAKDKDKPAGAVEVYEAKDGGWRFRITDAGGKSLAIASKGYKTKEDATKVIDAVKDILATTKVTEGKAK